MFENFHNLLTLLGGATLTYFVYSICQSLFHFFEIQIAKAEFKKELKREKARIYRHNAYRRGA